MVLQILFQISKLLNPVLLQSNFAREADYRAPKARVRGVDDPYMPPSVFISLSHTHSVSSLSSSLNLSLSFSLSLSLSLSSLSPSLFCTGGRLPSAEGASTGGRQSVYASDCTRLAAKPLVHNKTPAHKRNKKKPMHPN